MPYKTKNAKAAQMRKYRKKKKKELEEAKRELAKQNPNIPKVRNLLGVKVRPVVLTGKKPKKKAKKR